MANHPNRSKREPQYSERGFYEALEQRFCAALEPATKGALTYEQARDLVFASTKIFRQGAALPVETVEKIIAEMFGAPKQTLPE